MMDPAIDQTGEPFSYLAKPTDVIGVMDARAGTLISPEGYLYTGYGELTFLTGDPAVPMQQGVKTLLGGYLPILEYAFRHQGIDYQFTIFGCHSRGKA